MDAARVKLLLAVWERSIDSLPACRDALEANGWDVARATASLRRPRVAPLPHGARTAEQLLAVYKEYARKHRDVTEGTLPRSIVWITEHTLREAPMTARWERHRWFLGAPMTRWLAVESPSTPRRAAGFARLRRPATQTPVIRAEDESALALRDARFIKDTLQAYAARSGTRVAIELFGRAGWLGADGCDEALADAFPSAPEIADAEAHMDAHPDRREDIPDCGWAAHWEIALARIHDALCLVDLSPPTTSTAQTMKAIEAAMPEELCELVLRCFRHRCAPEAIFTDILDRMSIENGGPPIGQAWREVPRAEAQGTITAMLTISQAYDTKLLSKEDALTQANAFLSLFEPSALFYTNGDRSSWTPILNTTFERGIAAIDGTQVAMFYVGDED